MNIIPIANPVKFFEFTTRVGNDSWRFVFKWNESFSLYHVDAFLGSESKVYGKAVLGGIFVLPNFNRGYNFLFLGGDFKTYTDLGLTLKMYTLNQDEAKDLGLIT
jgi:hypothetical protein